MHVTSKMRTLNGCLQCRKNLQIKSNGSDLSKPATKTINDLKLKLTHKDYNNARKKTKLEILSIYVNCNISSFLKTDSFCCLVNVQF